MSKTTLTLTENHALLASKTALANCSHEDTTPSIEGARFRIVEGNLEVVATDRYTVSRHRVTPQRVTNDGQLAPTKAKGELDVIVPRTALTWMTRNALAFKRAMFGGKVVLEFHVTANTPPDAETTVTITVSPVVGSREALSATFPLVEGNYPPVERLIEKAEPADVSLLALSPEHLAKLHKFIPRYVPVRFEFTAGSRPDKPGPIKWTVADLALDGLIQPNLLIA